LTDPSNIKNGLRFDEAQAVFYDDLRKGTCRELFEKSSLQPSKTFAQGKWFLVLRQTNEFAKAIFDLLSESF